MAEASGILGITAEAVRTRIKRGKLDAVKEPPDRTGTVYVLLEADQTGPNINPVQQSQDQTPDQTRPDEGLVEALREQVAYLQGVIATRDRELEQRAEEIRRRDAALEREQQLAAIFADRLRELEVPAPKEPRESPQTVEEEPEFQEPPKSPQTVEEEPERAESLAATGEAQEGTQRPWWRRWFGG